MSYQFDPLYQWINNPNLPLNPLPSDVEYEIGLEEGRVPKATLGPCVFIDSHQKADLFFKKFQPNNINDTRNSTALVFIVDFTHKGLKYKDGPFVVVLDEMRMFLVFLAPHATFYMPEIFNHLEPNPNSWWIQEQVEMDFFNYYDQKAEHYAYCEAQRQAEEEAKQAAREAAERAKRAKAEDEAREAQWMAEADALRAQLKAEEKVKEIQAAIKAAYEAEARLETEAAATRAAQNELDYSDSDYYSDYDSDDYDSGSDEEDYEEYERKKEEAYILSLADFNPSFEPKSSSPLPKPTDAVKLKNFLEVGQLSYHFHFVRLLHLFRYIPYHLKKQEILTAISLQLTLADILKPKVTVLVIEGAFESSLLPARKESIDLETIKVEAPIEENLDKQPPSYMFSLLLQWVKRKLSHLMSLLQKLVILL